MTQPINVVVTGAAGQMAYSLLYQLAAGSVFGKDQPINLRLLEVKPMIGVLKGVIMELEDLALPIIKNYVATADAEEAFKEGDAAFLTATAPLQIIKERRELLSGNVGILKEQGEAIDKTAKKSIKVVVITNPVNTGTLVCQQHAPSIPKENFTALTRLDHNRAQALLASRLNVGVNKVQNVIIWGNHSGTQFADATHAKVCNRSVPQAVNNQNWLNGEFLETIQQRGQAIIAARKTSSAMSAAKAAGDHMRDWWKGTKEGEFVSMGVVSDGSYGMPKDIVYSFPVTISNKEYKIVQGLSISDFAKQKMTETAKELEDERNEANAILNK